MPMPAAAEPTATDAALEADLVDGVDVGAEVEDLAMLASRLRLSATRLARRLRNQADMGLSPSLLSALATVHVHGPLTLGELAEREGIAPPTVTKVVGRLEGDELVERTIDQDDRRICRVATTDRGELLLADSRARKNAWLATRLSSVEPERRARLLAAIEVLEELASGEDPG